MPGGPSSFSPACGGGAGCAEEVGYTPGLTIIATQHRRRLGEVLDCVYNTILDIGARLRPFIRLSKYGLGISLILCVTVIWVASSVWIQYIFGALEFNRPFFLTYFNTTGFCFWNLGFCFSARWRRTQWDEASRAQPVCVEDERLVLWDFSWTRDSREQGMVQGDGERRSGGRYDILQGREAGLQVGIGADGETLRVGLDAVSGIFPHDRSVSGVGLGLFDAAPHGRLLEEEKRQSSLSYRLSSSLLLPDVEPFPMQPPLYGSAPACQSRPVAACMSPLGAPASNPACHANGVPSSRRTTSVLGFDNDDIDVGGDVGRSGSGERSVIRLHFADECRDDSISTSSVTSAREEVVSVVLTDDDEMVSVDPQHASAPLRRLRYRARRQRVRRYSLRRIWRCALCFCPLWFFANYMFNLSLSITSVASTTILSSTSSIWTFFFSYALLHQPFELHRCVAVALSVGGTILVGLSDTGASGGRSVLSGNIAALLSAFFYGVYTSVLKLHLPEDERFSIGMLFGALGVVNLLFLWPGLVLISATGVEPFVWPSWKQLWPLMINSLIGTNLSDVLWARSVILTSPVVSTLGLSLTTPLAMVVDILFKSAHFSAAYVTGAILVTVGFLLANVSINSKRVFMCGGAQQGNGV